MVRISSSFLFARVRVVTSPLTRGLICHYITILDIYTQRNPTERTTRFSPRLHFAWERLQYPNNYRTPVGKRETSLRVSFHWEPTDVF